MRNKAAINLVMAIAITSCASVAAAEVNFAAESVSVSEDAVTTYIGDVIVRATADVKLDITAKSKRSENGADVYEGDVRIALPDQLVKAEKATVTKTDAGDTLIKMDLAESVATD